jgi:hypothetical protein
MINAEHVTRLRTGWGLRVISTPWQFKLRYLFTPYLLPFLRLIDTVHINSISHRMKYMHSYTHIYLGILHTHTWKKEGYVVSILFTYLNRNFCFSYGSPDIHAVFIHLYTTTSL